MQHVGGCSYGGGGGGRGGGGTQGPGQGRPWTVSATISFPALLPQREPPQIQRSPAVRGFAKALGLSRHQERAQATEGSSSSDHEQREPRGGTARTSSRAPLSLVSQSPSIGALRSSHRRPGCSCHTDARATRPAQGQPLQSPSHANTRHARLLVSGHTRVPVGPGGAWR